jgi:hypothetical protein
MACVVAAERHATGPLLNLAESPCIPKFSEERMIASKPLVLLSVLSILSLHVFAQQETVSVKRDPQAIEILTRTANAAGGVQALSGVRDVTESGEITFYWGQGVTGTVTIRMLGANCFRLDADTPEGKSTWVVRDGFGSQTQGEDVRSISREKAANLESLTFPVGHVTAALEDKETEVSLVGIEKRSDRALYRVRVKGRLGLVSKNNPALSITKDLLIDALTFDIVSLEDCPFPTTKKYSPKESDPPPRELQFADYRVVSGVRVPFSIISKVVGQETVSFSLNKAALNNNLRDADFQW